MTYRDRRLARAERLRDWAEKRARRSDANFSRAWNLVKEIPLGQPILVGHHSEKRHRRTLERSDNAMRAGVESQRMAESMSSRADNIEQAAEHAIYSDDPDAVDRLRERIADLEAERTRYKAENAAYRKGNDAYAAYLGITPEQAAKRRETIEAGYSWCRQPHPSYSLQNLGGNITRLRKRLAFLSGNTRNAPATTTDAPTATERAGLIVTATMTTPSRPGKKPREVWNVTGNIGTHRALLIDCGGSWYRGVFSFWDDPTEDIERACLAAEVPTETEPCDELPDGTIQ